MVQMIQVEKGNNKSVKVVLKEMKLTTLSLAKIWTLSTGQLKCSEIFHRMLPTVSLLWVYRTHTHTANTKLPSTEAQLNSKSVPGLIQPFRTSKVKVSLVDS